MDPGRASRSLSLSLFLLRVLLGWALTFALVVGALPGEFLPAWLGEFSHACLCRWSLGRLRTDCVTCFSAFRGLSSAGGAGGGVGAVLHASSGVPDVRRGAASCSAVLGVRVGRRQGRGTRSRALVAWGGGGGGGRSVLFGGPVRVGVRLVGDCWRQGRSPPPPCPALSPAPCPLACEGGGGKGAMLMYLVLGRLVVRAGPGDSLGGSRKLIPSPRLVGL